MSTYQFLSCSIQRKGYFHYRWATLILYKEQYLPWVSLVAQTVKNLGLILGSGRFPGGGCGNPLQYSCLENPYGQRSLEGYSTWGHEESDTTERPHFHFSLSCIGKGNGNSLQCSCLENPRDGEPGGLLSMGLHRVGHDWNDWSAAAAVGGATPFLFYLPGFRNNRLWRESNILNTWTSCSFLLPLIREETMTPVFYYKSQHGHHTAGHWDSTI